LFDPDAYRFVQFDQRGCGRSTPSVADLSTSLDTWLEDGELLRGVPRLAGIRSVLIHGRFDIGSPPDVPWLLHRAWPGSDLHLVRTGHQGGTEMTEHMMTALNRFART
jgi:pimeloyl-ACP methyl ester carboxylesterase